MNTKKTIFIGAITLLCTAASGMNQHLGERQNSPAAEKYKHLSIMTPDELGAQMPSERIRVIVPDTDQSLETIDRLSLIQKERPMPESDEICATAPRANLNLVNTTKSISQTGGKFVAPAKAQTKSCSRWLARALLPCASLAAILILMRMAIKRA